MADDVTIVLGANSTPPDGTVIATDDVGGAHYQRMKLTLGADGAVDMDLDSGQQMMANSAPVTIASDQSAVPIAAAAAPTCYNITMTLVDTEYSQIMPANCRRFEFQCRTAQIVRFAFVVGKVAGPAIPYMTLKSGASYDSGQIDQAAAPSTLYVACSGAAAQIIEILAWV